MEFTKALDEKTKQPIIRYKGRKCGSYSIGEDSTVEFSVDTATGQRAWSLEFGEDQDKVNAFFLEGVQTESAPEPTLEPTPVKTDEEIIAEWRVEITAKAVERNQIVAMVSEDEAKFFNYEPTAANIEMINNNTEYPIVEMLSIAKDG